MKTIWFCGKDEERLTTIAEEVGIELVTRDQKAEIIVYSEVKEILGRGLKDDSEENAAFTDRLGFLGHLLHRNDAFALIVSTKSSIEDRKKVKEEYKNYIQVSIGEKDNLTDIPVSDTDDVKSSVKQIVKFLIDKKLILEEQSGATIYSKDEEEEIRRRLEELGYV